MTGVIHIAAPPLTIDGRRRQRCLWCGALIDDVDLTAVRVAVQPGEAGQHVTIPFWEPGGLVAVDGAATYVVKCADDEPLPDGCCGKLDPDITA